MAVLSDVSSEFHWINIVAAIVSTLFLMCICIASITRMNANRWQTVPFVMCISFAVLSRIGCILGSSAWLISSPSDTTFETFFVVNAIFHLEFFICVLCILILRLWVVFKDSVWQMSTRTMMGFITLNVLLQTGVFIFALSIWNPTGVRLLVADLTMLLCLAASVTLTE